MTMRALYALLLAGLAFFRGVTPAAAQGGPVIIEYQHTDAIGSVRSVTDANGIELYRYDYAPFGADPALGACATIVQPRGWAGQFRDRESCLVYFGARYYGTDTGRFTSVDPALDLDAALADPQRWNRYAYANNNPLKFVDPDGREIVALYGNRLVGAGLDVPRSTSGGFKELGLVAGAFAGGLFGPAIGSAASGACLTNPVACIKGLRDMLEGLAGAPPTPSAALDDVGSLIVAGQAADRGGLTIAGRALEKHGARPGSTFPRAMGNVEAKNTQGLEILTGILESRKQLIQSNRFGGRDIFDLTTGRGARFDRDGKMIGFLER